MKNVAYGITDKYDWPSELLVWGEIRGKDSNLCVDSMGHKGKISLTSRWYISSFGLSNARYAHLKFIIKNSDNDGPAQSWYCHKQGGNQLFRVNADGQIAQNLQCLYPKRYELLCLHIFISQDIGFRASMP